MDGVALTEYIDPMYAVRVTRDIVYARAGVGYVAGRGAARRRDMCLDLYLPAAPAAAAARPAVLLAFGGAFHRGCKEDDAFEADGHGNTSVATYARELAGRGYVSASVDYRLTQEDSDPGTTPVYTDPEAIPAGRADVVREMLGLGPCTLDMLYNVHEAAADDLAAAIRFMHENAGRYGVDASRIAAGGFSAGARSAMAAIYGGRAPAAAFVSISGLLPKPDLEVHLTGRPDDPPILMFHSENDLDYVREQAPQTMAHLKRLGHDHEAYFVPGAPHFYPMTAAVRGEGGETTVLAAMLSFLRTRLRLPQ